MNQKHWDEFLWVCAMLKKHDDVEPIAIGTKYLWTAAAWFDYLNIKNQWVLIFI